MTRIVQFIVLSLILTLCFQAGAQQQESRVEPRKAFNELYQPLPVILRLSYENFKNIKLLNAAVVNFGGGEDEFDRLVEEYAEASSLYFRNEYIQSANKFTENEKNIAKTADSIARKYKEITEDLNQKTIKMKVRATFRLSLSGRKIATHAAADEAIRNAGYSLSRANDLLSRSRPIDSIYYYRRSKENNFLVYKILADQFEEKKKDAEYRSKKSDAAFFDNEAKRYALPDGYKKDLVDNKNRVYESEEREKVK